MTSTAFLGTGHHVPPRVVTNNELAELMDTSDEWIRQRTGILERRFVEPGVGPSDLAYEAARIAIEQAGLAASDIDLIVFATVSPEHYFPGSGVLLQNRLGVKEIGALDIRQQCTGFVYGLAVADQFIRTGTYRHVLLVGAEVQSIGLNLTTEGRDMACLFGDGAGAAVLGPAESDGTGVLSTHLHSQGEFYNLLWADKPGSRSRPSITPEDLAAGRHFPEMDGRSVFKHATRRFREVIDEALEANQLGVDDVDLFVFHQANLRIIESVGKSMGIPPEKVFNNLQKYGNTTAASIPICIDEAVSEGKLHRGDLLCAVAFGSGFTWASALVRW